MMVVLGVVVFFTMLGFMGLEMATKDSQVSGTLLDIKSKESAAWGGLNLAIGAMQANPSTLATELQKFIADSAKTTANKRQWISFSGGSFSLVGNDPGFFALGSGSDKSGVKVRVVSLDLNGATGINSGGGVPITLECTGQGRNEQQLKIVASYRILGIDVPAQSSSVSGGSPAYALYLNGNLSNSNVGTTVTGNVYIGGTFSGNSAGPQVIHGNLKVNGDYTSNATLTVDSNAWIGGNISLNASSPMTFKKSLGVGGSFTTINANISVSEIMNVYGPKPMTSNWGSTVSLTVGKQLYIAQDPQTIGATIVVGSTLSPGNAFFQAGVNTSAPLTVYGNLVAGSSATQPSNIGNTSTVTGSIGFLDKGAGPGPINISGASAKLTVTGNARFDGPVNQPTSGGTSPIIAIGGDAQFNGGITEICNAASNAISVMGKTFMQGSPTVPIQTNSNAGCRMNGGGGGLTLGNEITLTGTISGSFGQKFTAATANKWTFTVGAANKTWRYFATGGSCAGSPPTGTGYASTPTSSTIAGIAGRFPFYGGDAPRIGLATTSNSAACNTTAFSLAIPYVANYSSFFSSSLPTRLTDPAGLAKMSAIDTMGSSADNPPDTMFVDSIHSPGVHAKMRTLTAAIQTAAGITGTFGTISDVNFFNKLYTYFTGQGWLHNGYMVIKVASAQNVLLPGGTGFEPFLGKAIWILDGNGNNWWAVNAGGLWPSSATSSNIQVIHVTNGIKFQNFGVATASGTPGTMYGFVYYATDLSGQGWYKAADKDVGGVVTYGTVEGSIEVAHPNAISTWVGKYVINQNEDVFRDISTNLPGVLHLSKVANAGTGSGTATTTSTKTLVARSSAGSLQFVRVGEFR